MHCALHSLFNVSAKCLFLISCVFVQLSILFVSPLRRGCRSEYVFLRSIPFAASTAQIALQRYKFFAFMQTVKEKIRHHVCHPCHFLQSRKQQKPHPTTPKASLNPPQGGMTRMKKAIRLQDKWLMISV